MPSHYTNLDIISSDKIEEVIAKKLNSVEYKEKLTIEGKKFYGDIGGINMGDMAVKRSYNIGFRPGLVFTLKEIAKFIGVCERTIMNLQRELDIIPLRMRNRGIFGYKNFYTMYDVLKILNHYFRRKVKKEKIKDSGCSTRESL